MTLGYLDPLLKTLCAHRCSRASISQARDVLDGFKFLCSRPKGNQCALKWKRVLYYVDP